ncbi:MAG TPA: hypothetical protein PKD24_07190 [Pyrinomonadaceae bacterium]|nr:hypothetical protein [Pyrinomonadaceae bacterium]HMP66964.1 hypothetical protein [Pyrinomonadaceae bacterium]
MNRNIFDTLSCIFTVLLIVFGFSAQTFASERSVPVQEISEVDGLPVILKHLPAENKVEGTAAFINDRTTLEDILGPRPLLQSVVFGDGTEAATAMYPVGRLLIIEYTTPQSASAADAEFLSALASSPDSATAYRRIGNYSVFVFDGYDPPAALGLIDQVKYTKQIHWLGEDPFLLQKLERYFAITAKDVAISTVLWIFMFVGIAVVLGLIVGVVYYRFRERQRLNQTAFSDAGGLTRLNLDDLSEPITPVSVQ